MVKVRTATPEDLATVVETAARSLDAEVMLRWSFGEERFEERIRRHFTHYDGENVRRGWVRIAEGGAGIAVWIPPDAREEHEAIGWAPPGGEAAILSDNAGRHTTFWEWIGEHEPSEPLLYLSHIGVIPERQGEGLGSALMRDGLAAKDHQASPLGSRRRGRTTPPTTNGSGSARWWMKTLPTEDRTSGSCVATRLRNDPCLRGNEQAWPDRPTALVKKIVKARIGENAGLDDADGFQRARSRASTTGAAARYVLARSGESPRATVSMISVASRACSPGR